MEQLTVLRFFNFLPRAIFISYRSSVSSSLRVFLVYSLYSLSSFCRIKKEIVSAELCNDAQLMSSLSSACSSCHPGACPPVYSLRLNSGTQGYAVPIATCICSAFSEWGLLI